jgi:hypothetical protein
MKSARSFWKKGYISSTAPMQKPRLVAVDSNVLILLALDYLRLSPARH